MTKSSFDRAQIRGLQREVVREVGISLALAKTLDVRDLVQMLSSVRLAKSKAQEMALDSRIKAREATRQAKARPSSPSVAVLVIPTL